MADRTAALSGGVPQMVCQTLVGRKHELDQLMKLAGTTVVLGEAACRSLLRKSRGPAKAGDSQVAPALAALGITDREADVLALVVQGLTWTTQAASSLATFE